MSSRRVLDRCKFISVPVRKLFRPKFSGALIYRFARVLRSTLPPRRASSFARARISPRTARVVAHLVPGRESRSNGTRVAFAGRFRSKVASITNLFRPNSEALGKVAGQIQVRSWASIAARHFWFTRFSIKRVPDLLPREIFCTTSKFGNKTRSLVLCSIISSKIDRLGLEMKLWDISTINREHKIKNRNPNATLVFSRFVGSSGP